MAWPNKSTSFNFAVLCNMHNFYGVKCRLNDQTFRQSQTCINCSMHFNSTSIIGDEQQATYTCIQLVWELKQLWKITKAVPWFCKRGWMRSLLQSMHCILFIRHMLGLIHWLREVLLWTNIIQLRKLKERQMSTVSSSTTKNHTASHELIFSL